LPQIPSDKPVKRVRKDDTNAAPLLRIRWHRVVLDEAHVIKDRSTRTAKAAFALSAECRWAVTVSTFLLPFSSLLFSLIYLCDRCVVFLCSDSTSCCSVGRST
jgi:hypothetical protein